MLSPRIQELDFELAYLVQLTRAGLKPLSRWEKSLAEGSLKILNGVGLKTAKVQRTVRSGRTIRELIFSMSDRQLERYLMHFDHRPVDRSSHTGRMEGLLFGYPACCVEHFIRKGYAPNGLSPDDQRILFHWACPGCNVTPSLLPHYREIYEDCRSCFAEGRIGEQQCFLKKGIAVAASLALLASTPKALVSPLLAQDIAHQRGAPTASLSGALWDPHWIPLPPEGDADQDYVTDEEELHVGTHPDSSDTDGDGVLDGVQLAQELWSVAEVLPRTEQEIEPYRIDHPTFGLETCEKCGETVNMGIVVIINPDLDLSVEIPYVGLHFMEHGGFSYAGDIHAGRVNVPLLHALLTSERDPHWLAVEGDADQDGLTDDEEIGLETDPQKNDTDLDGIYDGVELAVHLRAVIDGLPTSESPTEVYLIEHFQWGIESCDACGETVNMGCVEIVNPMESLSIEIPCIGLHYMEHGSFAYAGDLHQGRANAMLLHALLESDGTAHLIALEGDSDGDGLTDEEEIHFGSDPDNADSNLDGSRLAKAVWSAISALDTVENAVEPYLVEHRMRGLVSCPVCGMRVNMGYVEIVNLLEDLRLDIPYLGLHCMERGSFAYGFGPEERVDPIRATEALHLPLKGDINRDGRVNVSDVVALVNFILGTAEPTPDQFWAADVNDDGVLNIIDVVLVVKEVLN
jgi:hypothetical protein